MPSSPSSGSGNIWRSVFAVVGGVVTVVVTSLGVDELLHVFRVFPPWGEPMNDPGHNLLALSYRIVFGALGSFVTATLAPHSPWKHVWIGAGIGFVLSTLGVVAAMNANLGPLWYPIALALTVFPCAGMGGMLFRWRSATHKRVQKSAELNP